MKAENEIRIENVKEAVKDLNYSFRFKIGIIIVMALIVVRGDVWLKQDMEIPFINIVAPSIWVAWISLILYLLIGISMYRSYSMISLNLNAIRKVCKEDFDSLLIQPSIWISGNRTTKCLIILSAIAIFTIILLPTWPDQKWYKAMIVPLSMSIPYGLLIIKIWRTNKWEPKSNNPSQQ